MISQNFEYAAPATLDEALELIAAGAKPLAGGMSLIPMMKLRLATPDMLVYIGKLKDLNYIREAADGIHVGAASTHNEVEVSALIRGKCPLLGETVAHWATPWCVTWAPSAAASRMPTRRLIIRRRCRRSKPNSC